MTKTTDKEIASRRRRAIKAINTYIEAGAKISGLRDGRKVRFFAPRVVGMRIEIDEITPQMARATGCRQSKDNKWIIVRGSGHCPVNHVLDIFAQEAYDANGWQPPKFPAYATL